jgi:hypothetical protein
MMGGGNYPWGFNIIYLRRMRTYGLTNVGLDCADLLLGNSLPDLGQPDHGAGVHDSVAKGVGVVPAHGVHAPVRRPGV